MKCDFQMQGRRGFGPGVVRTDPCGEKAEQFLLI